MSAAGDANVHPKLAATELQHSGKDSDPLIRLLAEIDGTTRGSQPNGTS